jgi:hypothetical protein
MRAGQQELQETETTDADEDVGWKTVKRQPPCDRNSLWRMWLQGLPSGHPRVKALLQDYELNPQEFPPEDWPIDPWTLSVSDREHLARKYASSLPIDMNKIRLCFFRYLLH